MEFYTVKVTGLQVIAFDLLAENEEDVVHTVAQTLCHIGSDLLFTALDKACSFTIRNQRGEFVRKCPYDLYLIQKKRQPWYGIKSFQSSFAWLTRGPVVETTERVQKLMHTIRLEIQKEEYHQEASYDDSDEAKMHRDELSRERLAEDEWETHPLQHQIFENVLNGLEEKGLGKVVRASDVHEVLDMRWVTVIRKGDTCRVRPENILITDVREEKIDGHRGILLVCTTEDGKEFVITQRMFIMKGTYIEEVTLQKEDLVGKSRQQALDDLYNKTI